MSFCLILSFLFFIGSLTGWIIELVFRRVITLKNPGSKWVNPGFCTGPYLPIYGFGLCVLYIIASFEKYSSTGNTVADKIILFIIMAICMTAIEYIAGIVCLRFMNVRLWDYSNHRWNVQGIICPAYSAIWAMLGAIYYFLIHPHILDALMWLSENLAFSFVIGFFFGIFVIDVINSAQIVVKLRRYAQENNVIIKYEVIKNHIRTAYENSRKKYRFFRPFRTWKPLGEHLRELHNMFEDSKKTKTKR